VVGSVLVPGHDDAGDPVVRHRPSLVIRLRQHRVHPLEGALRDAGRLAEPRRARHDQDLGREDLVADRRPLVALSLVRLDAGRDRVVDDANRLALDALAAKRIGDDPRQRLSVRGLRRPLQGAVEDDGVDALSATRREGR